MADDQLRSDLDRLLRVAADRNKREEYGVLKARLLRTDISLLRSRLAEERISANVFVEAIVRGYLRNDPAIVGLIDDWRRTESKPVPERKGHRPSEIDEIYAAIGGDIIEDEE